MGKALEQDLVAGSVSCFFFGLSSSRFLPFFGHCFTFVGYRLVGYVMFNSVRLMPISVSRSLLLECDPDRILVVVTYQDFPQEFTQWRHDERKMVLRHGSSPLIRTRRLRKPLRLLPF